MNIAYVDEKSGAVGLYYMDAFDGSQVLDLALLKSRYPVAFEAAKERTATLVRGSPAGIAKTDVPGSPEFQGFLDTSFL